MVTNDTFQETLYDINMWFIKIIFPAQKEDDICWNTLMDIFKNIFYFQMIKFALLTKWFLSCEDDICTTRSAYPARIRAFLRFFYDTPQSFCQKTLAWQLCPSLAILWRHDLFQTCCKYEHCTVNLLNKTFWKFCRTLLQA